METKKRGNIDQWDGLTKKFVELVDELLKKDEKLKNGKAIMDWYKASKEEYSK